MSPTNKQNSSSAQENYKLKGNKKYSADSLARRNDEDSKQQSTSKKPKHEDEINCPSDTTDTDGSTKVDNVSEDDLDDKSLTESCFNNIDNFMNMPEEYGDDGAKNYIRDALDFAEKLGYLKPQDSSYKVLRVSSDFINTRNNSSSSGKRSRSSSGESQIDDEVNEKKSPKKKKRKITKKSSKSRSRSRSGERESRKPKNVKKRDKKQQDKKYKVNQDNETEKDLKSGRDKHKVVKSGKPNNAISGSNQEDSSDAEDNN